MVGSGMNFYAFLCLGIICTKVVKTFLDVVTK